MSAAPRSAGDSLDPALARRIDRVCNDFEAAWKADVPAIEGYLNGWTGAERAALLRELVLLDVDYHRRRGQARADERYLGLAGFDARWLTSGLATAAPSPHPAGEATRTGVLPTSSNAVVCPSTFGDHEVCDEIARGGMGVVLRIVDRKLDRELAVKLIRPEAAGNPELVRRFLEEARVCGRLQHPGIVPLHELGQLDDGRPYFTMKLIQGQTLARLLAGRPTPAGELPRFLKVFEQVCQAVAYAHSRGVVHRDLKPANIMVGEFGEVQVMDWGLAKVLASGESEPPHSTPGGTPPAPAEETQAGQVLGTLAYMAPEQARGDIERLDERCDVFGLGAILCEILTGRPPYLATGISQLHQLAAEGDLSEAFARLDCCGVEGELVRLTERSLNSAPEGRPRHAGILAAELTAYLESVEERLRQAEMAGVEAKARAEEERKRRRLTLAVAGAVMAAILVAGGVWVWSLQQKQARAIEMAGKIDAALKEADSFRQQADRVAGDRLPLLKEALAAAKRAEVLAASGDADATARARVQDVLDPLEASMSVAKRADIDRRFLARLMDIRTQAGDGLKGADQDFVSTDARYDAVFREHGIDVNSFGPEQATLWRSFHGADVADELAAALDDWAHARRIGLGMKSGSRQSALARALDPDSLRDRIRAAIDGGTLPELRNLARSPDALSAPLQTVTLLAVYLGFAGDTPGAINLLKAAHRRYPDDFQLNHNIGWFMVYRSKGRSGEALRYIQSAIALRPRSAVAWKTLIDAQLLNNELRDVIDTLGELSRGRDVGAWPHQLLGVALMRSKQWGEAAAAFREVTRLRPDDDEAYYLLSTSLLAAGRTDEAATALAAAIRLRPGVASRECELGLIQVRQGKPEEAFASLHRGLSGYFAVPANEAYTKLLFRFRTPAEAVELFASDRLLATVTCEVQFGYACLLLQEGRLADYRRVCIAQVRHTGHSYPWREAHLMARTGVLAPNSGMEAATLISLAEEGVRAQPRFPHHIHALGLVHLRAGRYEAAIGVARESIAAEAGWVPGLNQLLLALAHQGLGKSQEARRHLAGAKKQRPKPAETHYHDRWSYEVLLREAESLISVPTGSTP